MRRVPLTDYDFTMTISGSAIGAYTSAGSFDFNGDLTNHPTGGTVLVDNGRTTYGRTTKPLDADGLSSQS